jgi:hypothetical protein
MTQHLLPELTLKFGSSLGYGDGFNILLSDSNSPLNRFMNWVDVLLVGVQISDEKRFTSSESPEGLAERACAFRQLRNKTRL